MYKVILVDDEPAICKRFQTLIDWKSIGYDLVGAFTDGADAIAFLKENNVDLVLTDIQMPDVSGIDVSRFVCENNLAATVAFISAYDDITYAKEGMRYNVRFYLNKPLTTKQLKAKLAEIREYLDDQRLQNDFFASYRYSGYFNGIATDPAKISNDYDFTNCRFCIFELLPRNAPVSEKLSRALYNIFTLNNSDINFCILSSLPGGYRILIFSREEIPDDWQKTYCDIVRDCLEIDLEIKNLHYFSDVLRIRDFFGGEGGDAIDAGESKVENNIVASAITFIDQHLSEPLTLEIISSNCFVSGAWLSRLFKKCTGQNINIYITERRLQKAKELLKNTNMTVYEIVDQVGYRNLPHFHSLFKKQTGMTPMQYRNKEKRHETNQ